MVVSYTRDLLEQITGERPEPDQDGDLLIEFGGACFYVRVWKLHFLPFVESTNRDNLAELGCEKGVVTLTLP